ncbi:E3 SUMO-protein ligase ZBED1 [Episyrphus balteatus]|uniref:E3 SUMO-protein ligase ZBED1 n=1 Tax=Episyrphus balteatus TaxID=286459 RepID=UPI002486B7CB|nr:E3 SUMO-protein ligase ZBED1 [Episyrphus balteatus]
MSGLRLRDRAFCPTTVQYIDKNWKTCTHTLSTALIEERPSAENIALILQMVHDDWDISNKANFIVHDNANVMKAAVRLLKEGDDVNCSAHTLQLCVKDAFKNVEDYEIVAIKCRRIISHFHQSNVATSALNKKQLQLGLKEERLVQSCTTRWDSIYFMCDTLHRNRSAVIAVLSDKSYTNSSTALNLEISEHGWGIMEELTTILKPLHIATKVLCSETKSTISAVRSVVKTLIDNHYSPKRTFVKEKILGMCSETATEEEPGGSSHDQYLEFLFATEGQVLDNTSQFEQFIAEPKISNRLDPLAWWRSRERAMPVMATLAKKYLAVSATSASSERLFSTAAGNIVTANRSCLAPENVSLLVFLNKNEDLLD